jgi:divalent metal cation (Fe/Co/Zn/Cd) transporter
MGLEGGIAIVAGVMAGSIALIGFGIDSAIEGAASIVIIWRFTGSRLRSHAAERRAQKWWRSSSSSSRHTSPTKRSATWFSALGMFLTASSVVGMPLLGIAKQRVAGRLGSQATHGEGTQNLLCAYLAGAVFLGLAGNALFGAWWLDPVAALVIGAIAVREGVQTWHGEGCCAGPDLSPDLGSCAEECCS